MSMLENRTHATVPNTTMRDQVPLFLSVSETARLLGIGKTLCWEMVYSGQLPSVRLGRRVLIPRAAVERLAQVGDGTAGPASGATG